MANPTKLPDAAYENEPAPPKPAGLSPQQLEQMATIEREINARLEAAKKPKS